MIPVRLPDSSLVGIQFTYKWVQTHKPQEIQIREVRAELRPLTTDGKEIPDVPAIAVGYVRCDSRDNFSYEQGRKRALTRALYYSWYEKSERELFWHTYLNRPRPKSRTPEERALEHVEHVLDQQLPLHHEVERMEGEGGPPSGPQCVGDEVV